MILFHQMHNVGFLVLSDWLQSLWPRWAFANYFGSLLGQSIHSNFVVGQVWLRLFELAPSVCVHSEVVHLWKLVVLWRRLTYISSHCWSCIRWNLIQRARFWRWWLWILHRCSFAVLGSPILDSNRQIGWLLFILTAYERRIAYAALRGLQRVTDLVWPEMHLLGCHGPAGCSSGAYFAALFFNSVELESGLRGLKDAAAQVTACAAFVKHW